MFNIGLLYIAAEQFLLLEAKCQSAVDPCVIAEFISSIVAFHHAVHSEVVGENHSAGSVVFIKIPGRRHHADGIHFTGLCTEADHRVGDFERDGRSFSLVGHDIGSVVIILFEVLVARRQLCIIGARDIAAVAVKRRIEKGQVRIGNQPGVAGLLKQPHETQIELRRREKSTVAPARGEIFRKIGKLFRSTEELQNRFVGENLSGIISGCKQIQPRSVFPRQIVHADVAQFAFAHLIVVQTQIHLRHRAVQPLYPGENRLGGSHIIFPVDRIGFRIEIGHADARAQSAIDDVDDILRRPVTRRVADAGHAGAFDHGAELVKLARLVDLRDQVVHQRNDFRAGGNDQPVLFCRKVVDPFDPRLRVVTLDRVLDKGTDIGRLDVFEFIDFACNIGLGVILNQTDLPHLVRHVFSAGKRRRLSEGGDGKTRRQYDMENTVVHGGSSSGNASLRERRNVN